MLNRIAYLILTHIDPIHLKRLVNRLNTPNVIFFIHVDKKTDITPFLEIKGDNIVFIKNRIKVYWGGISQIKATLELIKECLKRNENFLKVVLLSGTCYPIKSNEYIYQFFENNKSINFIKGINITKANTKKYNYSIKKYHFLEYCFVNSFFTRITRKSAQILISIFYNKKNYIIEKDKIISIFHGSQWWALNVDFLKYVLNYDMKYLNKYFKYARASDELFFHTIFFNSRFTHTNLSKGENTYSEFTADFANIHLLDQSLRKWFTIEDFKLIKDSEYLFVRKVSSNLSKSLLDKLDDELT